MDDGCGVITTFEAVRTLVKLKYRPERTVRIVAFAGEEYGGYGGRSYASRHSKDKHVFAFESDAGCFLPYGFRFNTKDEILYSKMRDLMQKYLVKINCTDVQKGGGGVDIGPIVQQQSLPCGAMLTHNENYFDFHHSEGDRMDVLDADELDLNVASVSAMVYLLAQMEW